MRFNNYLYQDEILSLLEFIVLIDDDDLNESILNEGFVQDVKTKLKDVLNKAGLHGKQGKGVIQYLISAGTYTAQMVYHAIMAYYKPSWLQEPHKEKIKELSKKVNKEDVIDFMLKMDQLTMHLVTGPIHMIDALVGSHIWANVSGKVQDVKTKAKNAITSLESLKDTVDGKLRNKVQKYSNALRRVFGIGGHKKIKEEIVGADISGVDGETNPDILIGDKCPITGKKRKKCKCKDCMMRRKMDTTSQQ